LRVLGWLGDHAACGHYRLYFPFQLNGWDVTDRASMDADLIVAQRPVSEGAARAFAKVCADDSKFAVVELDDDLFHLDPSNPAAAFFDAPAQQRKLIEGVTRAGLVTVSTEPLAQVCREYNDNVVVLPNYIPRDLLTRDRPANDRVVIGWAGSNTHGRDFGELAQPLRRVLQRYADRVLFHCVGTDYTPRVASRRGRTWFTGWSEDVWDYYDAIDFDIGLAPLFDCRFNHSKSDLRLKELAALGVPTVASNVGPYATAMRDGCPALPARTPKDWERALCALIEDAEHRHHVSSQAREWAAQHTIEDNAHRWQHAYQQATREATVAR
jgi:glycosyltransferase involved in cell wall biosynthesis